MDLKSFLKKIEFPENTEFRFFIEGPLIKGELSLLYARPEYDEYLVHTRMDTSLQPFKKFRFEGVSRWASAPEGLSFSSYEEKDFSKKIHKKYEIIPEGLNYIENKKGLILEREVQYFSIPEEMERIFDPMSALALFPLEFQNKEERKIFIFGKQRIIQLAIEKTGHDVTIKEPRGTNATWTEVLNNITLKLNDKNFVEEAEVPLPMGLGRVKMKLKETKQASKEVIHQRLKSFIDDFE